MAKKINTKTIVISRHGEAGWSAGESDFERELTAKGRLEARHVGVQLSKFGVFDQLIHSSARRTTQTAEIIHHALEQIDLLMVSKENLFNCLLDELLREVRQMDSSLDKVILVGHNPSLSEFVSNFSKDLFMGLSTGAVAVLEFSCESWRDISKSNGKLLYTGKFEV